MIWDQFYYGVCYYPEQWDVSRHESDIARIARAGFNVVRLGEGAWGYFEPREGKFQFDLFDRVLERCTAAGLKVIFGTPTYCAPAWVATNYPEALRWNYARIPMAHGSRRHFNYTSAKYLELSDRICTALAEHYRDHPAIIGWQIDNEFNCHMDTSYASSDTVAFRRWLGERYGKLENLNRAWGTSFWSQQYDDWNQIDLPHPTSAPPNPTQLLDETRFISDTVIRFAQRQAAILRRTNPAWKLTHNGLFDSIDGRRLVRELDFFSHDQYPLFHAAWTGFSAPLLLARSLSFPYAVMEQQSGPGGQMSYLQRTPRPGEMRLWTWQGIAHGANFMSYFRWRTCPFGAEQRWHGLIDQDDRDTRRLAEAVQVGQEIRSLPEGFLRSTIARCVGVLRDFQNETLERRINTWPGEARWEPFRWIAEFSRRHISTDIVWPDSDLSGYRYIIAPHVCLTDSALVETFRHYVESGGTLVLGAQSGLLNGDGHVVESPLPGLWRDLAGVEIEDWSTLPKSEIRTAKVEPDIEFPALGFVERIKPLPGTVAIAHWLGDDTLLASAPAMTRRAVGRGYVFYIGAYLPETAIEVLAGYLLGIAGLEPIAEAARDVEIIRRSDGQSEFIIALNHSAREQTLTKIHGRECFSGKRVAGELALAPYAVAIVEKPMGT